MKGVIDLKERSLKRQILRNIEYYDSLDELRQLYTKSQQNTKFTNLMEMVTSERNILLAYRNLKKNKGSKTAGTDKKTIEDIENLDREEYIKLIRNKFSNYNPKTVRRVLIPKYDGRKRPLGIPCIEDRIIQQCIKQVIEPICEAKFHKHSYGFRPLRATEHAIARAMALVNMGKNHYVVDIDIKGFFDNVNHGKLMKQLWTIGIRDKTLLKIISKILKSEVEGEGKQQKGTPQGGILSPLLSNVVLNELDWWISSQWETFETEHKYHNKSNQRTQLKRNSKLKEIWLVRYADDFKIFCKDYKVAIKIYNATRNWLKERLDLEISPEKSKITNLRRNHSEFLGIKFKVRKKGKRYVCKSNMSNKAKLKTIKDIRKEIKLLQKNPTNKQAQKFNSMILGKQLYFRKATDVYLDFEYINWSVIKSLDNRLRNSLSNRLGKNSTYIKLYGEHNIKYRTIDRITLYPIQCISTVPPMNFNQDMNIYTEEGIEKYHKKVDGYNHLIRYLIKNDIKYRSVEYCDNRISKIIQQHGKCYVSKKKLVIGRMECHHKTPKQNGGTDDYNNLVWIDYTIHKLIHATETKTINKYINSIILNDESLRRLNTLRKQVGNSEILK